MSILLDVLFVVSGLLIDNRIFYVYFIVLLAGKILKEKKINTEFFLQAAVYSIILPDNYVPEVMFLLYFIVYFISTKGYIVKCTSYLYRLLAFILITIISSFVNFVPFINIGFAVVTFFPVFAFLWMSNDLNEIKNLLRIENVEKTLNRVLQIELLATIVNFFFFNKNNNDDWSKGTFIGNGEQAQLFVVSSFLVIYYFYRFNQNRKEKSFLYKMICALVIVISTNSWLLLLLLLLGIVFSYIFTLKIKRIIVIVVMVLFLPVIWNSTVHILPQSVTTPVIRMMSDSEFLEYRFHKLATYKETFSNIASEDIKYALIGNGIGNYNSRAALICTGSYVDFYNDYFDSSMSEYTEKYIYNDLLLSKNQGSTDYGSILARPYSSVMALMGETGYIGIFCFILVIIALLRGKRIESRMLILAWLAYSLGENYFEYPKVIIMLYVCLVMINISFEKDKKIIINSLQNRLRCGDDS